MNNKKKKPPDTVFCLDSLLCSYEEIFDFARLRERFWDSIGKLALSLGTKTCRNSREISRKSTFFLYRDFFFASVDMIFFCSSVCWGAHNTEYYMRRTLIISRSFFEAVAKIKFQTESDEFNCKTESRMYCDSKRSSGCTIYLLSDYICKKTTSERSWKFFFSLSKKKLFEDSSELHCLCVDVSPLTVYTNCTHTTNRASCE